MTRIEMHGDAYPEQLLGALRDEIRREERQQQAADAARRRRRERWVLVVRRLKSLVE
jgi:hypothetical protein